jgi:transcriptional regulator with XRE-family HTH domain
MLDYTDSSLLKQIGGRIRTLRKKQELSLRDLAFKIGMEPSNLSVIENGKSNPQLLTYAKIASALQLSLKELFDFDFNFEAFSDQVPTYVPRKHDKG